MSDTETCVRCWEQIDATHENGLCPKCGLWQRRTRRREPRPEVLALPGQLDLLELLGGDDT